MGSQLDIDDVCATSPKAAQELKGLRDRIAKLEKELGTLHEYKDAECRLQKRVGEL